MYMNDIKLFAENEKELEILLRAIKISSQDIGMEFAIEKCALLIMKGGKRQMSEGIIIIIIMSQHQHEYLWPPLATTLYRQSLTVGLQGYILYRHRAVICRF